MSTTTHPMPDPNRRPVLAVGARLRKLLYVVLGLFALLFANSAYLATITALEWMHDQTYQNYFYQVMFLAHLVLGLLLVVPFIVFACIHMRNTWQRRNRRAVRVGYGLLAVSIVLLVSGLMLFRIEGFVDLRQPTARRVVYWMHVITPILAVWLYVLHRLAGPRIKWRFGLAYAGVVGVIVAAMAGLHSQDPRRWHVVGPKEGERYFHPSLARTSNGNFIPAETLMMDDYCKKCHADVHAGWTQSAHRFSSFNNPVYLASVRETRQMAFDRDGDVRAARWCAGCHDTVPFFSGAFDDPKFDDVNHATAQAGLTCTTCHAITNVNSNRGNADYTIEEPQHYPFATSDNAVLQWVNNQLVKAKPEFHKRTFLKDFHTSAEFCSACHKVHLPFELNHYKAFLRGQNHYDPYLLSGVSGHGARSFYYPEVAKTNCSQCHMPLAPSDDFGAKLFEGASELSVHNHLFPTANTGIAWLRNFPEAIAAHEKFHEGNLRVDIFGIKENGSVDGQLHAPLRPEFPELQPGGHYLLETVIRTLKVGHLFTQGTIDSNEVWMDVTVTSGDRVIGRSGAMDDETRVDPWSHFVNAFVIDENGNRIDRRNPQDIRVALYNNQIPPGAGSVVHYDLQLPNDLSDHVTIEVKLQYRKFDKDLMDFAVRTAKPGDLPIRGHVAGEPYRNELPITTLATDRITLPVAGVSTPLPDQPPRDIPPWQRWNDYGIGLFLKGKAELLQAEEAFKMVESMDRYDGPLNLARVYEREGRVDDAAAAINRAAEYTDPAAPPWTLAWLSGLVNRELPGRLTEAEQNFRSVLDTRVPERRFDFSFDFEIINLLGETLFDRAKAIRDPDRVDEQQALLREAVETFQRTLAIDSENVTAHYNLQLLYQRLGDTERAEEHHLLHERYKPDDNVRDRAVGLARQKYPAANHAAEALVIYPLRREGAPGLPADMMLAESDNN